MIKYMTVTTEIKERWKTIIDESYKPYKKKARQEYEENSPVFKKIGVNILDISLYEPLGVRFLNKALEYGVKKPWFIPLFRDGETFFKYFEMVFYNIQPFDMYMKLAAEYEGTEIANTIKEKVMTAEFEQENNDFVFYIYQNLKDLYKRKPDEQDRIINMPPEVINGTNEYSLSMIPSTIGTVDNFDRFYQIFQGNTVNMLHTFRTKKLTANEHNIARTTKGEFELEIKNYNEIAQSGVSTAAFQFLLCLLATYRKSPSNEVIMTLDEYKQMRELTHSPETRIQVDQCLKTLERISIAGYNIVWRKDKKTGQNKRVKRQVYMTRIIGAWDLTDDDVIRVELVNEFIETFNINQIMNIPRQSLTENAKKNPNTPHFIYYIAENFRLNRDRPNRVKTITIKTMLEKTPELPTYQDVMSGNRRVRDRIITPFFRDLDVIADISYAVTVDNIDVTYKRYSLSWNDFKQGKLTIDYSMFPQAENQIAKRNEYREKAKKTRKKEKDIAAIVKQEVAKQIATVADGNK
jgi:hypothetical protein